MDRIESLESKFRFVHAAARRARQLQAGAPALTQTPSRKPTRIAMEEVLSGSVTFEIVPKAEAEPPVQAEQQP